MSKMWKLKEKEKAELVASALRYKEDKKELYIAETGWQDWMDKLLDCQDDGYEPTESELRDIDDVLEEAWRIAREGELISIQEWASNNGISGGTARQRAERGAFITARKVGRNWTINSAEPLIDHRRK